MTKIIPKEWPHKENEQREFEKIYTSNFLRSEENN